jgi:hypothetical protein
MPQDRVTLCTPILSRTASTSKDARTVNGYFETVGNAKHFVKRPGFNTQVLSPNLPSSFAQGMYVYNNYIYVVSNNTVYKLSLLANTNQGTLDGTAVDTFSINSSTPLQSTSSTGSISGTITPCSFTQTANNAAMVFHNTFYGYYMGVDNVVHKITDADFPSSLCPGIVYLDGYIFVMTPTGRIYQSAVEDPSTWGALDFVTASAEPDPGVAIAKHFNYVVAFGTWSTEFFYDAANATGSVLARNDAARMEIGCASASTVQPMEQTLMWVGQSLERGRSAYILNGTSPVPVSTRYIEKYLNAASMANDNVRSFSFKIEGHHFYVLSFFDLDVTLVYDLVENEWYQWSSWDGDNDHVFDPAYFVSYNSKYYVLGSVSGQFGELSCTTYTDTKNKIAFRCVTPIVDSGTTKRKFYRSLEIVGDKVTTGGSMSIRHSDDDYTTWSSYRTVNLGNTRSVLFQLGQARRRAWEFFSTSDVPLRIEAAEIAFDVGELENK